MALLFRGESNTKDNNKLELYTYSSNIITDVNEAKFRIFDITSDANRALFYNPAATPGDWDSIQEYPATAGEYKIVDVTNLADNPSTPGHKLGIGHYFAEWTAPEDATPGSYVIVWDYKFIGDVAYKKTFLEFVVSQANFFTPEHTIADDIREHMRDYVFANELIDGVESTDRQIQRAIDLTVKRYNMLVPRIVNFETGNFPMDLCYLMVMGATGHLLKTISLVQLRNQLTYTDGGVHVGITDKHQLYKQYGRELHAEFDEMAKGDKITRNLDSCWGAVHSPYHGYYTFWGV